MSLCVELAQVGQVIERLQRISPGTAEAGLEAAAEDGRAGVLLEVTRRRSPQRKQGRAGSACIFRGGLGVVSPRVIVELSSLLARRTAVVSAAV